MKELTFDLENKLAFANLESGEDDETFQLYFKAPDWNCRKQMFRVKSHVERSFVNMASQLSELSESIETDTDRSGDDAGMEGPLVMTMLAAGSGNLDVVFEDFKALALKVGRLNDNTPLLTVHFERMGIDDAMRLCGEYIGFFVMPSVLSMTKKAGSER